MTFNFELVYILGEAAQQLETTEIEAKYMTTTYTPIERHIWYVIRFTHAGHNDFALMADTYNTVGDN